MAKTDYVIRQDNPTDFDQIDIFDPFAGDRPKDIAEGRCIVAELNSQVIGYVVFQAAGFIGRPFVQFLAVAPDHRRCGIATILLQTVERRIGSGRLFISTEADNVPMKHLLAQSEWIAAGCVAGVNNNDVAECFFYRDIKS